MWLYKEIRKALQAIDIVKVKVILHADFLGYIPRLSVIFLK